MALLHRILRFAFRSVFLTVVTLVGAPVVAAITVLAALAPTPAPSSLILVLIAIAFMAPYLARDRILRMFKRD